jgi:nitric oxide reductase NorE protein
MSSTVPEFLWTDEEDLQHDRAAAGTEPRIAIPGLPAEPGLWVFVLGDMTVFGWFFLVFMWERRQDRADFADSVSELYQPIGVVNTLVLLLGSYLVVLALRAHRLGRLVRCKRLLGGAVACGAAFAALKAVEYSLEISDGHTPGENAFFLFYFTLTGIHLVHVLIGTALLFGWFRAARRGREWKRDRAFAESAAVYWHMVDLLWILIFTLIYLVSQS